MLSDKNILITGGTGSFGNKATAVILQKYEDTNILIEGHTDSRGKAAFNRDLSLRRAGAVRDYLVGAGIEADRLETQGFGCQVSGVKDLNPSTRTGKIEHRIHPHQMVQELNVA